MLEGCGVIKNPPSLKSFGEIKKEVIKMAKRKKRKAAKRKPAKKMKKKRCAAKTMSGKACKKYAVGKSRYCESHK